MTGLGSVSTEMSEADGRRWSAQPGDPQREREQHLRTSVARTEASIAALDCQTVKGYRGGRGGGALTASYAESRATELANKIDQEVADGDKVHDRVSTGMKWLVLFPVLTDFLIVGLFLASIFNVSLAAPLETPAETVTAVVMAGIVTVGLAVTLRWVGGRRRQDKLGDGRYPSGSKQWLPRLELALVWLLIVLLATVMIVRVAADAASAGIALGAGWLVAIFLAVVTAALNWIIFYMEFADGSTEDHELDHWGTVLGPIRAERAALIRKRDQAHEELLAIRSQTQASVKELRSGPQ